MAISGVWGRKCNLLVLNLFFVFPRFTNAQEVILNQDSKYKNKPIEHSHFFHMDTTGNTNCETTSMADFVKPEMMTGK
jgi:hypothetical protein